MFPPLYRLVERWNFRPRGRDVTPPSTTSHTILTAQTVVTALLIIFAFVLALRGDKDDAGKFLLAALPAAGDVAPVPPAQEEAKP